MCRALATKIKETELVLKDPAGEMRVWQGDHYIVGGWRELCSVYLEHYGGSEKGHLIQAGREEQERVSKGGEAGAESQSVGGS